MPHPAMTGPEIGNCDHEHCCDIAVSWNKRVSGFFKGVKGCAIVLCPLHAGLLEGMLNYLLLNVIYS
jgi:hypothetical protein